MSETTPNPREKSRDRKTFERAAKANKKQANRRSVRKRKKEQQ